MPDELDPLLAQLFEAKRTPLREGVFIEALLANIKRRQRAATRRHALIAMVLALLLLWQLPSLLRATAAAVQAMSAHSPSYGALIISPLGWALSMLVGLAVILRLMPRRL